MSDTPRTDAQEFKAGEVDPLMRVVPNNLARQLEQELQEAKRDAERYRWLRASDDNRDSVLFGLATKYWTGEEFDAAIDAAMKEQRG